MLYLLEPLAVQSDVHSCTTAGLQSYIFAPTAAKSSPITIIKVAKLPVHIFQYVYP